MMLKVYDILLQSSSVVLSRFIKHLLTTTYNSTIDTQPV